MKKILTPENKITTGAFEMRFTIQFCDNDYF